MKTYYSVLNITPKATNKQVDNAYKITLSQLNQNNIKTIESIKRAYSILGNYHKRREYDNYLDSLSDKDSTLPNTNMDLIGPNIDGIYKPFLRNNWLDNKIGDSFIDAEIKFNEMQKQCLDKKKNFNLDYYVQSQKSNGQRLEDGKYEINTSHYVNNNEKEQKNNKTYYYTGQGNLIKD
jgi:DnaJ-class molecular chaperone